jgi:hypothetical protein
MSFFSTNFFLKLERILILTTRKAKGLEMMIFFFIIDLKRFGSKMFLTFKIMDFENVILIKVLHVYVIGA